MEIDGGKWSFACDAESHRVSQELAPDHPMTGESCGRQIWYQSGADKSVEKTYTFSAARNPNSADKIFRDIMIEKWTGERPDEESVPETAREAATKAMAYYQMLQCEDGHWAGDYGGPMFLMPGLICSLYLMKVPFPPGRREGMIQYLRNHQQIDGGWGTHIECASTIFGTILSYIALRLLGVEADEDYMRKGREFILAHGGALYAPSWAKFWMAVIGIYEWDGINSIPAEMFLLPKWFPFHPGKLWCHCRMVYTPMCYAYCMRYKPDVAADETLLSLRKEIYCENYDKVEWDKYRQTCASIDEYSPLNPFMKVAQDFMSYYEYFLPKIPFLQNLRKKALAFVIEYIHAEDEQTNYVDIGPVNKALNMLAVWIDSGYDINSEAVQRHIPRIDDYIWVAEDGVKMQGYNGSQCWDTSFCAQAMIEGNLASRFPDCAKMIYKYLDRTQIRSDEDDCERYFRHISKGGWPFSTAAHGWPITDCTSEGLKAVLALHKVGSLIPVAKRLPVKRLQESVDVILSLHNPDGGWATYENNRGYGWYELMNPSEVFGDIMIDYSYVECSSACISALKAFTAVDPEYRAGEVLNAIKAGGRFVKSIQRNDGSWYGSWGNCFTYGTWFGIDALLASGESADCEAVQRAASFLLSKQNANGGWGESYLACVNKTYPYNGTGEVLC